MSKMGISTLSQLPGRADLRGHRHRPGRHRRVLHRHRVAHPRRRPRARSPRRRSRATRGGFGPAARPSALDVGGHLHYRVGGERTCGRPRPSRPAEGGAPRRREELRRSTRALINEPGATPVDAARPAGICAPVGPAGAARRGRARARASCKRFATGAMSLRQHLEGGAREPRHRHEPHRRRAPTPARAARTRRASSAPPTATRAAAPSSRWRSARFGVTARLPRQRRRAADQDGPGRQARRGRPAPRPQGRRRSSRACATRRRA